MTGLYRHTVHTYYIYTSLVLHTRAITVTDKILNEPSTRVQRSLLTHSQRGIRAASFPGLPLPPLWKARDKASHTRCKGLQVNEELKGDI